MLNRRDAMLAGVAAAGSAPLAAKRQVSGTFLWGVATAAHVIEGNNINSDYWVLENLPGTYFHEPSGDACDSFNRWRDDLALIRLAGLNSYRFSVEWARIEPEPGQYSAAMLTYYRNICVTCREMGIEPVVTFHHFTNPRWIAALGGWENPATVDHFARYCAVTAKALGDVIRWACTLNEPNAQVTSYIIANGSPWKQQQSIRAAAARHIGSDRFGAFFMGDAFKVRDNCLLAHAKGRDAIKTAAPQVKVGITLALQQLSPGPGGDALYRRIYDNARAPFYAAAATDDFIGVQAYYQFLTGPTGYLPPEPGGFQDKWNYAAPPSALTAAVREAHDVCRIPVFVTEHGFNTDDDARRIDHTRASVTELAQAIDSGLPVIGYMHFSLMDTFEWSSGYVPTFGMAAVDRVTFRRTPRPSLAAYRRLIGDMRTAHKWA